MWFDARAKLAEIEGQAPATSATTAPAARPVSQVSQGPEAETAGCVASIARAATQIKDPHRSAIDYVNRVGLDVAANRILRRILKLRGDEVYRFFNEARTNAAFKEIEKLSRVRAIHIENAVRLYGRLSAQARAAAIPSDEARE